MEGDLLVLVLLFLVGAFGLTVGALLVMVLTERRARPVVLQNTAVPVSTS